MPQPNEQFTNKRLDRSSSLRRRILRTVIVVIGVILLLLLIAFVLMKPFTVFEKTVSELDRSYESGK